MKISEKAKMLMSIRLPRGYCSDLYHGVSTTEASKGVLNGEWQVTRYLKHRYIARYSSLRLFLRKLPYIPRSLNITHALYGQMPRGCFTGKQSGVYPLLVHR